MTRVTRAQLDQARDLVRQNVLDIANLKMAFASRDLELFEEELAGAREKRPFVADARDYIKAHILADEPAIVAASFTAACFGGLTTREFSSVAQDLVKTRGLVKPQQPAKPDEPAPVPRTWIDDETLDKAKVVMRDRSIDGLVRMRLMVLNGAERYRQVLRDQLPVSAPLRSAAFVEQMSDRLIHGAISLQRFGSCSAVIAQTLLNEGETSAEALGKRLARYWFADGAKVADQERERRINLAENSGALLAVLCDSLAEFSGLGARKLQIETAISLVALARASSTATAWRVPAAAAFAARLIKRAESGAEIERLVQACLDASPELLTVLCAGLSGGFGFEALEEPSGLQLDAALLAFAQLANSTDDRLRPRSGRSPAKWPGA